MSDTLGLYLHIPFCLSKCGYCDFYSLPCREKQAAYVDKLCRELERTAKRCPAPVDTVFFGGGTPSLLTEQEAKRIYGALDAFSLTPDAEITMEINPATATGETLSAYRRLGCNRVSIGMQAGTDAELKRLSRRHSARETAECVSAVKCAGFENFSLDLMYGLPEQTKEDWEYSLKSALSYQPKHLSLYALTLSENVPMAPLNDRLPPDECQREFYFLACEMLSAAGYLHYEISNFALPGYSCRHNLRYWKRADYLGFGPGAASFYRNRRYEEPADLDAYLATDTTLIERIGGEAPLTEEESREEELFLSLRLGEGLDVRPLLARLGDPAPFLREIETLQKGGLAVFDGERLTLNREGFFVSNEILSRLLMRAGL